MCCQINPYVLLRLIRLAVEIGEALGRDFEILVALGVRAADPREQAQIARLISNMAFNGIVSSLYFIVLRHVIMKVPS